jgi:hypothetical protein
MNTPTMTEKEKLAAERYAQLKQEREACEAVVAEGKQAADRLRQIQGTFGYQGELEAALIACRDLAAGPILIETGWDVTVRVVDVTDQHIVTRTDGQRIREQTKVKYRRSDGRPVNSRVGGKPAIDVEKAVSLWQAWSSGDRSAQ